MNDARSAVEAVLFDLDDTLYPQRSFLLQAWSAVADESTLRGSDRARLFDALVATSDRGSASGRVVDDALALAGFDHLDPAHLVASFCRYRPTRLVPDADVVAVLDAVRATHRLAVVTDGIPAQQRAKLTALGLRDHFDAVVCSDDAGRAFRKPHRRPFLTAARALQVDPCAAVMVGDSPHKDIAGARSVGMTSVRLRRGEYRHLDDEADHRIDQLAELQAVIATLMRRPR